MRPDSTNPRTTIQIRSMQASGPPVEQRLNAAKNPCPKRPPRFSPSEGARSARRACGGSARTGKRIVAHRGARAPARGIQLQPDHVRVERARPDAGPIRTARDHQPGPGPPPDLLGRGAADADEP